MDTMNKDCFFFVDMDEDVPEEKRCIDALCSECRAEKYPDTGWYHQGSVLGYAEGAVWKCKVCGLLLSCDEGV